MGTNSKIDYLTYLFEKFTFEEINEDNISEIEDFLLLVLDSNNNTIFSEILWYNFLLLLKSKDNHSFYLGKLIKEAEEKSLRVFYHAIMHTSTINEKDLKCSNKHYKRCVKKEFDQNGNLYQREYKIDDEGNFIELISETPITDTIRLNNINLSNIYEDNMKKVQENDL